MANGATLAKGQRWLGVTVTAGNTSERTELRHLVQAGSCYIFDRGYADSTLFQERHDLPYSFIGRGQYAAAYEVPEERPVTTAAHATGVWCMECEATAG